MRHFSFSEEPNQDWIWTEITEAAQFTWSLAEQIEILYCTCLKSCTCLNLAMASADNPKPLDFSPGLPIPLSGRPIFLLPQSNILTLHNHNSYSFLLSCKLSQISFILPLSFLAFPFWPQFLITSFLNLLNHLQLTSSKCSHFQAAFLPPHFKCLNISPFLCHHCCDGTSFLVLQPLKSQSIQLCVHKTKCPQIRQWNLTSWASWLIRIKVEPISLDRILFLCCNWIEAMGR